MSNIKISWQEKEKKKACGNKIKQINQITTCNGYRQQLHDPQIQPELDSNDGPHKRHKVNVTRFLLPEKCPHLRPLSAQSR